MTPNVGVQRQAERVRCNAGLGVAVLEGTDLELQRHE